MPSRPLTIDEMTCNVCDGGESDPPNEIVICDNCGIGKLASKMYSAKKAVALIFRQPRSLNSDCLPDQ